MRAVILPYKKGSKSAKALATRLGELLGSKVWRIKPTWAGKKPTTVINWGFGGQIPNADYVWNMHSVIASNKLHAFLELKDKCNVPEFSTNRGTANDWIHYGYKVVCRTILSGHSGAGIVIANSVAAIVDAPLYVKYVPKKREYRVHVAFDQVIDVQQKRKREGFPKEETNYQVRNHHTGWVYCRQELQDNQELLHAQALNAVKALGLQFGAVDIIYNELQNKFYVLEVNTAPGLEGQTVESYAQAFFKELTRKVGT